MYYHIAEISTSKQSNETFVLVHYWKTKADHDAFMPPHITEQFDLQLRTSEPDLKGTIQGLIRKYWAMALANGLSGDHTMDGTKPLYRYGKPVAQKEAVATKRDATDPHNVLKAQDIKDLDDSKHEELEAAG